MANIKTVQAPKIVNITTASTASSATAPTAPEASSGVATFRFGDKDIRVVDLEGEPWFVAQDVCKAYNPAFQPTHITTALRPLSGDEKRVLKGYDLPVTLFKRGITNITLISESGLYKLVMRSDKPEAKAFQDWVTREVLPSIRKTPEYFAAQV